MQFYPTYRNGIRNLYRRKMVTYAVDAYYFRTCVLSLTFSRILEIPLNYDSDRLQFARFDVARMLERGARLMGSEGTEFDCQEDFEVDSRENLLRQRALLNERLGFNSTNALGINISDLVTLDDMRQHNQTIANGLSGNGDVTEQRFLPLQELLRQTAANHVTSQSAADALSCRQMNRFKRKARQNPLQSNGMATTSATLSRSSSTVSNGGEHNNGGEPDHKIAKLEYKTDSNISNGGKTFCGFQYSLVNTCLLYRSRARQHWIVGRLCRLAARNFLLSPLPGFVQSTLGDPPRSGNRTEGAT